MENIYGFFKPASIKIVHDVLSETIPKRWSSMSDNFENFIKNEATVIQIKDIISVFLIHLGVKEKDFSKHYNLDVRSFYNFIRSKSENSKCAEVDKLRSILCDTKNDLLISYRSKIATFVETKIIFIAKFIPIARIFMIDGDNSMGVLRGFNKFTSILDDIERVDNSHIIIFCCDYNNCTLYRRQLAPSKRITWVGVDD